MTAKVLISCVSATEYVRLTDPNWKSGQSQQDKNYRTMEYHTSD